MQRWTRSLTLTLAHIHTMRTVNAKNEMKKKTKKKMKREKKNLLNDDGCVYEWILDGVVIDSFLNE